MVEKGGGRPKKNEWGGSISSGLPSLRPENGTKKKGPSRRKRRPHGRSGDETWGKGSPQSAKFDRPSKKKVVETRKRVRGRQKKRSGGLKKKGNGAPFRRGGEKRGPYLARRGGSCLGGVQPKSRKEPASEGKRKMVQKPESGHEPGNQVGRP